VIAAHSRSSFVRNTGSDGAVSVRGTTDVIFKGPTAFEDNEATQGNGGGEWLSCNSLVL
jgi:hypothetical protein